MKLFVGLGNPGKEYEGTRHNAGFTVLDNLAYKWQLTFDNKKMKASYSIKKIDDETIILLKPETYMNNSGDAVIAWLNYYKIDSNDLIIVHDDLDLPIGKIRLREKGSSGGQKGMNSIIKQVGTDQIKRIRIGIGRPEKSEIIDFVLGHISKDDQKLFSESINKASDALVYASTHPFGLVMNKFN